MNLQGVTIIFIIIFLPIFLISSFYIQKEVDTIKIQASYDAKLIDATSDAISAFEINTANENLSVVDDSLRSMIEASNNIFINTLASNLGMSGASQNKILPYIPAMVYTLYDGYYIYAPTQAPKVLTDTNGVLVRVGDPGVTKTNDSENKGKYQYYPDSDNMPGDAIVDDKDLGKILYCFDINNDPNKEESIRCTENPDYAYYNTTYMLKSFMPYTMRYVNPHETEGYDITINYTLDNFISVSGTKKKNGVDVYYTKSGYLMNPEEIKILKGTIDISDSIYQTETLDSIDSYYNDNSITIKINDNIMISSNDRYDRSASSKDYTGKEDVKDVDSAIKYYLKSYIFSRWFFENFGDLNENMIPDDNKTLQEGFKIRQSGIAFTNDDKGEQLFYSYSDNRTIFEKAKELDDRTINVEDTESNFYEHKRNVIKNSIQYNLNLAMAVYNAGQGDEYYQMPLLSDVEWDKLLSNVSLLSFMQGFPCGLKTYNNYSLVTSTNNELMTNINDIYYVPINNSSDGVKTSENVDDTANLDTAHKIDCNNESWLNELNAATYFQSFPSKDVKYDKSWSSTKNKYLYDHVVNTCYYCIVNGNNEHADIKDNNLLMKAQDIAIGKIRNNTYKSIAYKNNYGFFTQNIGEHLINSPSLGKTGLDDEKVNKVYNNIKNYLTSDCYSIEVTVNINLENYGGGVHLTFANEKSSDLSQGDNTIEFYRKNGNWADSNSQFGIEVDQILGPSGLTDKNKVRLLTIKSITFKYK